MNLLFWCFQRTPREAKESILELSFCNRVKSGGSGDRAAVCQVDEVKVSTFTDGSIVWSQAQGLHRHFSSPIPLAGSFLCYLLSGKFSERES